MAKSKREFGEGPFYKIGEYINWFLMGNLYFLLLNIPLFTVLFLLLTRGSNPLPPGFVYIIFICCIPVGPAVTALLSVMGKLIREKDINITKDYFKAYKVNFSQSLFFWTLELILICILYVDVKFFISNSFPRALTIFGFLVILIIVSRVSAFFNTILFI